MATVIELAWNATQNGDIGMTQFMDAVNHETTIDAYPTQESPAQGLTLAQLQEQMADALQLQLSVQQTAVGNAMKAIEDQIQQLMQTGLANALKLQELAAIAAKGSSAGGASEFPYITAGSVTPASSFPTNLTATYNGTVTGALTNSTAVNGTLTMTVNFANLGSIPGAITFANGQGTANFGLQAIGGFIGGQMAGTYAGQAITAGSFISGQFFGPAANEAGGNWNLNTAVASGSGNFAAKR